MLCQVGISNSLCTYYFQGNFRLYNLIDFKLFFPEAFAYMFALSDARDFSFTKVAYLQREEKITDKSNCVNYVT